jgi:hypothetical protein
MLKSVSPSDESVTPATVRVRLPSIVELMLSLGMKTLARITVETGSAAFTVSVNVGLERLKLAFVKQNPSV